MSEWLSISDTAGRCGVPPRAISDLLYQRRLDIERCPMLAGRRVISKSYLPEIRRVLRRLGRLPRRREKVPV